MSIESQRPVDIVDDKNNVIVTMPEADYPLRGNYQMELLKKANDFFLPCQSVYVENHLLTQVCEKAEGLRSFADLRRCTEVEKRLLLLRVGRILQGAKRQYLVYFHPQNIYYSSGYDTFFAFRALPEMVDKRWLEQELEEYKALILSVLQTKYTYDQLMTTGIEVLDQDAFFSSIIDAQTPQEVYRILTADYQEKHRQSKQGVIGFSLKKVKIFLIIITVLFAGLGFGLLYFAYRNIAETDRYQVRVNVYENHYMRHPEMVVLLAEQLDDDEMDDSLRMVVADSLIAVGGEANLERAFYLDASRQIECVEKLVELEFFSTIANLRSDKNKVQLYQAFYAKDYKRAIYLAEGSMELKYDAQAQVVLARAYMGIHDYIKAVAIVDGLGDAGFQLEVYQLYREDVIKNETNIITRAEILQSLDTVIALLEEENRGKDQ